MTKKKHFREGIFGCIGIQFNKHGIKNPRILKIGLLFT